MVFEAQPALSLSGTGWDVHSYNNGRGAVTSPLPDTQLTATFGTDGSIEGDSGCNSYHGSYTADGAALSIGPLATTRRACADDVMAQEQAFLTALQASTRYELVADRLTLRNDEGAIQVDFLPASSE